MKTKKFLSIAVLFIVLIIINLLLTFLLNKIDLNTYVESLIVGITNAAIVFLYQKIR